MKDDIREKKRSEENWSNKLAEELNKEREKYNTQLMDAEKNLKKSLQMVSIGTYFSNRDCGVIVADLLQSSYHNCWNIYIPT
jgi:hypothetical protein